MKAISAVLYSMNIVLFFVSMAITINEHYVIGLSCIAWSLYYMYRSHTYINTIKIKAFTLIELIGVIAIAGILMSIVLSIRPDTVKKDAMHIQSLLMAAQSYSIQDDSINKFILDNNVQNPIQLHNDVEIYFKKGVPVLVDGSPYIGCYVKVYNPNNEDNYYTIKINTFTGKLSYQYDSN